MRMAFIVFDEMTTLDLAGFLNAVTWLKKKGLAEGLEWDYCSNREEITDDRGMAIKANRVLPDLSEYDLLFIPGGKGTRQLVHNHSFIRWLESARPVEYKVSVCTGALLLGAAGLIRERAVTTNPLALDEVRPYCRRVERARYMRDGNVFTGGGITTSVDVGLFFVESVFGREAAEEIQRLMDYPYYQVPSSGSGRSCQTVSDKLKLLGIELPAALQPAGKYANVVRVNNLLFVSGKGPSGHCKGKLGSDYTTEEGYRLARDTAIQILAVLQSACGTLEKIKRVVKVQGFVNAVPEFEEHHLVLNGCSDLLLDVFGDQGAHARSVLGAASVRDNLPIIVDSIFEIEE